MVVSTLGDAQNLNFAKPGTEIVLFFYQKGLALGGKMPAGSDITAQRENAPPSNSQTPSPPAVLSLWTFCTLPREFPSRLTAV